MECCGEDENDQLLLSNPDPNHGPGTFLSSSSLCSSSETSLSPMNSNFTALLSRDLLRAILERLMPVDLARSACVCRLWRAIGSDREMQERAFRAPWNVRRVLGQPSSDAFWRHSSLDRFAISHRLRRGDSVAGLALRYSVQVMDIKRLNNMMSDHGIYSRERLLIPICKKELLSNATCYVELDEHAKREVAMLYLEGDPDGKASYLTNNAITQRGRRRILNSVRRSMQVDEGTAEYYLSVSNGDPRVALSQYTEDLRWEAGSNRI